MQPDVEQSSEQPGNSPINLRSSKHNLRHNPKVNCSDDYRYYLVRWTSLFHGTRTYTFQKFKERATWHIHSSVKLVAYFDMAIPRRLTHLLLTSDYYKTRPLILNSVTSSPHSAGSVLLFYYFFIFFYYWTTMLHIYLFIPQRSNNKAQGRSMRHKRGESTKLLNYQKTVSMESPFERLERHDDLAHSLETSHAKLVLPTWMQNLGFRLRNPSGD